MKRSVLAIVSAGLLMIPQVDAQQKKNEVKQAATLLELQSEVKVLSQEMQTLKSADRRHEQEARRLNGTIKELRHKADSLSLRQDELQAKLSQSELKLKAEMDTQHQDTAAKYSEVSMSLSKSWWAGLGVSVALLLLGGLGYFFLGRRQKQDHGTLLGELERSRRDSEEKIVSEFSKYTELLQEQADKLTTVETDNTQSLPSEVDHSLALKLASEINTIERNIRLMDEGTRGLKQLRRSVDKLKDNLLANGYEMPILLGKTFVQGMNVQVASTLQDESLGEGIELITKILVPQVNYQGKMIQVAQVEISVG